MRLLEPAAAEYSVACNRLRLHLLRHRDLGRLQGLAGHLAPVRRLGPGIRNCAQRRNWLGEGGSVICGPKNHETLDMLSGFRLKTVCAVRAQNSIHETENEVSKRIL
jgi:hypothetical protein